MAGIGQDYGTIRRLRLAIGNQWYGWLIETLLFMKESSANIKVSFYQKNYELIRDNLYYFFPKFAPDYF